ncbi:MAG: putative DNA binding domain-containing protein [Treponema sp.]|nr:putative DNA binding domain-containing protein [Treponema sp.]
MLKAELLEIIANGENSGIEFKRDDIRPEDLAKEIVAMANLHGGRILLGIEDDRTISGIQRNDLETWIMDTVFRHYIHPMLLPYYEEIKIDENLKVAVVSFAQGTTKPYVRRHNGREEIYVRVGTTSRLASREQQLRLFESGEMLHSEVLPVSGTSLDNLDIYRLTDYFSNVLGEITIPKTNLEWEDRLKNLGLMVDGEDHRCKCTIAGFVLFGIKPHKSLYQAGLRWISFPGIDMDYKANDDVFIDAPLLPLGKGKTGEKRDIIAPGLIEQVIERISPFISEENNTINEQFRREKRYFYPMEAIREALLNSFAHRDWTRALEITIINYADRIEINSPGALQNSMTLEKMLTGQRSIRNPIILETLRDYEYVDMRGMGVRRKIVPLTKEYTGKDAQFDVTDDYVKVIIPSGQCR